LDCDFLAFSGHKMLGPMGSGALYGKLALLDAMPPFMAGGGMIERVEITTSTWADVPAKFEAGTPAVGEAIGLGVAVQYLERLGMENVAAHERELVASTLARLAEVPGITIYGPTDPASRGGVIPFNLMDMRARGVAAILDGENVAVRAGQHCTQPLLRTLGVDATVRASFYVYNTPEDVDRLVAALNVASATVRYGRVIDRLPTEDVSCRQAMDQQRDIDVA
jgi:cysteine desulfurase / selenocysteine lyase